MGERHPAEELMPSQDLTRREYQVLALLAAGYPMKQIAYRLGITYRTVTFHKYRAMQRLAVRSNAGLLSFALRNNILESVEPDAKRSTAA
jgi:DNA-binding CsgD family transcriptional regulator